MRPRPLDMHDTPCGVRGAAEAAKRQQDDLWEQAIEGPVRLGQSAGAGGTHDCAQVSFAVLGKYNSLLCGMSIGRYNVLVREHARAPRSTPPPLRTQVHSVAFMVLFSACKARPCHGTPAYTYAAPTRRQHAPGLRHVAVPGQPRLQLARHAVYGAATRRAF